MKYMKKLLSAVLVLSLVFGLSAFAFADADLTTGTPWLASSVQGAVTEDTPTSVKDDFYLAVNKDALLSCEIQPGYSSAGVFSKREMENNAENKAIEKGLLIAADDNAKRMIRNFISSLVDTSVYEVEFVTK